MNLALHDTRRGRRWPWTPRESRGAAVVRRRYHFHGPGVAYAATLIVVMLGAINGQNNVLFWLFGLGVAGLLISGILSGAALMGLELEREPCRVATRGESMAVRYRLRNRNRLIPAFAITIEELPEPGAAERLTGLVAYASYVPARGEVAAEAQAMPTRRGRAALLQVRVSTTFPFGLTKKSVTFAQPAEILIRPRSPSVNERVLFGRGQGAGYGKVVRRGRTGDEFFALRDYVPGDGVRRVAWRASARLDRVVVREMASLPSRRVWVVPVPRGRDAEGEACVDAAAGLVRAGLKGGLEVGVASGDGRVLFGPRSGEAAFSRCLDVLAEVPPIDRFVAPAVRPGDAVVVVADSAEPTAGCAVWTTPQALGVAPVAQTPQVATRPTIVARLMARLRGSA